MNKELKVLNYYNEYSNSNIKCLYFSNIRFLGTETIGDNKFLRFELDNGSQFRRNINESSYYEQLTDINYSEDDTKNIKFKEIKNSDLNE